MEEKYYRFFEVLNSGAVSKITSPGQASAEAEWIIKEEYWFPCNSYTHSAFSFVDKENNNVSMQISNVEIASIFIAGTAEDYQLCLEFKDRAGTCRTYRLHDDIRFNYLPLIGPKAFTPKHMDWDRENVIKEIVYYLNELEKLGLEVFDEEFQMVAEIRELTGKYNLLRRNHDIAAKAARVIDTIEIKDGTEILEPYAIEAFSSLKKLVLPESIKEFQEYSLYTFTLKELYCKATTPPTMNWFAFGEHKSRPELKIYVPKGTVEEYAKAWGFRGQAPKEFTFIEYYE